MSDAPQTRIMVVEDERIVALNLKQRLVRLGYEVTAVVTSGEKALQAVAEGPPDVVLMDIHIDGDIDGIETAARIPPELNLPVVYLTAYSEEATLERARLTRPYGYLLKPFSERELHATLQMVLERRRADLMLRESYQRLGTLVETRTAELEKTAAELDSEIAQRHAIEEALQQAHKLEAIGRLTGGVAHDFNNLLTPIIGGLDMLQRSGLGGEREKRIIDGALASAERAKTVVQRLLAFARRQPLQAGAVDLAALLSGMGDLLDSTSGPLVEVVVDMPAGLPTARADANQLEMALLNLSVNARDAMPNGGTLRISARSEEIAADNALNVEPGRYICLSVADSGVGMDEATVERAIEPFFSTKGVGQGTGLGLSMVHGLVSQLGGSLALSSELGVGTTVALWFQVSDRPAPSKAASPAPRRAAKSKGVALLVDDEELVRISTAEMLKELGYTVVEVASAQEALLLIEAGDIFDVLLTDHLMPGMSGADLVRRVQQAWPHLPALVVSGYAEADGIAADLPRLTKPFRQADLALSLAALKTASAA